MPQRDGIAWREAADVVVVGYGYAGAVAAIEAHDAGADALLIEKMPDPGGISITSGGNVRTVESAEEGFRHLQATNAGTTTAQRKMQFRTFSRTDRDQNEG